MITRQSKYNTQQIDISVSLYGDSTIYIAGVFQLLKRMRQYKRKYMFFVLNIHHDNSVPLKFINIWKQEANVVLYDQSWRKMHNHERSLWRFITAAERDICLVLDLDEDPLLFLMESESFWFHTAIRLSKQDRGSILTHIPYWTHNRMKVIIPGSLVFFINMRYDPYGRDMLHHITQFLKHTNYHYKEAHTIKKETNEMRGTTYGLDEIFLTTEFVPNLKNTTIYRSQICKSYRYKALQLQWDDIIY